MNTEFKGTKETVHAEYRNGNQYFYFVNELKQKHFVGQMFYLKDDRQDEFTHNAELAVDAFNTIQSCGLLPSELLKQRNDMRELLELLIDLDCICYIAIDKKVREYLESTEVNP